MSETKKYKDKINKQFKESFAEMDKIMEGMDADDRVRFMNVAFKELRRKITRHANWALENLAGLDHRDFIFNKENAPKIFNCLWAKNFIAMVEDPENIKLGQALEKGMSSEPPTPETDESNTTGSITPSR